MADRIGKLFTPFTVRDLTVPNRFVMSPMNRMAAAGGVPGEEIAQFYRRRVDGKFGLIFTGGICVDHAASTGAYIVAYLDRPCTLPVLHTPEAQAGWKRVTSLVHEGGGKIIAQLWHLGVMRTEGTGYHPEVPSSRPSGIYGPVGSRTLVEPAAVERLKPQGETLSDAEIVEIIESYGRGARDAIDAGFDGVEIHGAQGYLPDAFLWEETNKRSDRWGGNRRERTRFAAEVVRAIRRNIGDKPLFFRFSQWKHQDLDAQLAASADELGEVLGPIAEAGVDMFDAGHFTVDRPLFAGSPLNIAGWAKKLTGRPAMSLGAVGLSAGQHDPQNHAEPEAVNNLGVIAERLERGEFDLVALGRTALNDPAFPRKIRLGQPLEPWSRDSLRGAPR